MVKRRLTGPIWKGWRGGVGWGEGTFGFEQLRVEQSRGSGRGEARVRWRYVPQDDDMLRACQFWEGTDMQSGVQCGISGGRQASRPPSS